MLIALSFLNLVYTFFEKISDKQFQKLFMEVFEKMENFPDSNNSKSDFDSWFMEKMVKLFISGKIIILIALFLCFCWIQIGKMGKTLRKTVKNH